MRTRAWELLIVVVVVALVGWFTRSSPENCSVPSGASSRSALSRVVAPLASASNTPAAIDTSVEHPKPHLPCSFSVHGIEPGWTIAMVHKLRGAPPKSGPLQVDGGQRGRWEEWGTPGNGCTWEGAPTVSYHANGTVLAVCGRSAVILRHLGSGGATPVNAGQDSAQVLGLLDEWLGVGPTPAVTSGTVAYRDSSKPRCRLVLTFSAGRLERVVLSADR